MAGLEEVARPQANFLAVQGLDQKVVGAEKEGAVARDASIVGRQHDHGNKAAPLPTRPQAAKNLQSVGLGHVKVQQDKVRLEVGKGLLGRPGIGQANDLIGDVDQEMPEEVDVGRLIVYDQDSLAHRAQSLAQPCES